MASTLVCPSLSRDEKQLARRLTQLLRHGKPRKLPLRPDGFVQLQAVRNVPGFSSIDHRLAAAIVAEDNKQRFALEQSDDGEWWIRANQGHTVQGLNDDELLTRIVDPDEIPVVVHGTYHAAWPLIRAQGLSRMKRNHVHFAKGLPKEKGVISGMRATAEILIYLDARKALAHGVELFESANGVVLTPGLGARGIVPTECFERVVDARTGEVLLDGALPMSSLQATASTTRPQGRVGVPQMLGGTAAADIAPANIKASDSHPSAVELESTVMAILRSNPEMGVKKIQRAVYASHKEWASMEPR
jgi:2'-phosphotransferase